MSIDLNQFRQTFFQEAAEHLESMEAALLALRSAAADAETLNGIFRCAHSMKAGAGMFGFETIGRLTHVLEDLLDRMRNGAMEASAELVELLLRSVDVLRALVDAAARGEQDNAIEWEAIVEELDRARLAAGGAPVKAAQPATQAAPESGSTEYAIGFEPGPDLFRLGLDPFLVLRDLAQLGKILNIETDLSRLPRLDNLDTETCYLGWNLRLKTSASPEQVRDAFVFVEDISSVSIEPVKRENAPAAPAAPQAAPKSGLRTAPRETSLRISSEKVDRLIDLVGELVIAQSMAAQVMNGFTPDRLPLLEVAMADLERHTRELQDRAMRIRMLPIGNIFNRFTRLVHDTAQALGKQVAFETSGEETELDKGMVERIADPLTHLVRNAVDHGIEQAEERVRAGKPAEGKLRLSAYHQGGSVVLEVADDGRGLDTARIRAKAVERGLIGAEDELSPEQIHALIFRPGFSTAEAVSDISGRGVGMDVVKKSVEALNGAVAVKTELGSGTCFRIKLPLTLAMLDGLLLRLGEQTYVLPLTAIVESIQPRREQVRQIGRGEVVVVREDPLPLLRLHQLFGVPSAVTDPTSGLIVIVEHDGQRLALLVDELLGQQQIVIKSLESNFRKVRGITGATILGDGRAALILDVAGIVEMSSTGTADGRAA
jgi:two-component system chemotaxis sensor kinase CheA